MTRKYIHIYNFGSSSLKTTLFTDQCLRICDYTYPHTVSMHAVCQDISRHIHLSDIIGIGHRILHGAERSTSAYISQELLQELMQSTDLAPLHTPDILRLIHATKDHFLSVPQIGVFDTAFHTTIPPHAAQYALPHALASKYHIKRYGFHGISHAYLSKRYHAHIHKKQTKLITLHLGNWCSAAAILNGRSIDTSMGFSPTEGLIMGTRSGDIDATILSFLCNKLHQSPQEVHRLLNTASGLQGISTKTHDMQELICHYHEDPLCQLAIDMFCYRIVKYIGAYTAILHGIDALIFSGGIGENAPFIRAEICRQLSFLGIKLSKHNLDVDHLSRGDICHISSASSPVDVYVIATDENIYIAQETLAILRRRSCSSITRLKNASL